MSEVDKLPFAPPSYRTSREIIERSDIVIRARVVNRCCCKTVLVALSQSRTSFSTYNFVQQGMMPSLTGFALIVTLARLARVTNRKTVKGQFCFTYKLLLVIICQGCKLDTCPNCVTTLQCAQTLTVGDFCTPRPF